MNCVLAIIIGLLVFTWLFWLGLEGFRPGPAQRGRLLVRA